MKPSPSRTAAALTAGRSRAKPALAPAWCTPPIRCSATTPWPWPATRTCSSTRPPSRTRRRPWRSGSCTPPPPWPPRPPWRRVCKAAGHHPLQPPLRAGSGGWARRSAGGSPRHLPGHGAGERLPLPRRAAPVLRPLPCGPRATPPSETLSNRVAAIDHGVRLAVIQGAVG